MEWPLVRLDSLYNIARGGSPRPIKDYITEDPDGINWIKIGDATASGKYIYETKQKIKAEGIQRSRLVNKGDFILSNSMSFGRPYIMATPGCIHDGWLVLSAKDDRIDQDFLYHMLGSPFVFNQFDTLAAGSTVRNLNIDLVSGVKIPLLPIPEQKRIVALLDTVFADLEQTRAKTEQNLKNARELFDSYLQQVFSQKGDNIKLTKLGEVVDVLTDYHANGSYKVLKQHVELSEQEDFAWMVRSTDFEKKFQNQKRYISEHAYNYLTKSKLFGGEIIMSKIGNAGKVYLMPATDRACSLAMNLFLIRLDDTKANNEYVYRYLNSSSGKAQIAPKLKGAATQTITKDNVRSLLIPLPSLVKQKEHILSLQELEVENKALEKLYLRKLDNIDELKKSILQKAFSSELSYTIAKEC